VPYHLPFSVLSSENIGCPDINFFRLSVYVTCPAFIVDGYPDFLARYDMHVYRFYLASQFKLGLILPGFSDRLPSDQYSTRRAHICDVIRMRPKLYHGIHVACKHGIERCIKLFGRRSYFFLMFRRIRILGTQKQKGISDNAYF